MFRVLAFRGLRFEIYRLWGLDVRFRAFPRGKSGGQIWVNPTRTRRVRRRCVVSLTMGITGVTIWPFGVERIILIRP